MISHSNQKTPMPYSRLSGLALLALLAPSAYAYHPFVTDDTGTQGSDGNQLEFVYDFAKSRLDGVTTLSRSASITYTRGVSETLDLYVATAHQSQPSSGLQNTALGAKWRFWEDEASGQSLGIKPEIRLPVSRSDEAKGLGTARTSWGVIGIYSKTTGFGEVHLNVAVDRNNSAQPSTDRQTIYRFSVAPVWNVAEGWKAGFDSGLETNPDRTQKRHLAYGQAALVYSPDKNLDLSLGIRQNFRDGPVNSTSATLGVTWRF